MRRYNPKDIETKWQKTWEKQGVYEVDLGSSKPKYIGFGMFNYPSGAGIHVGHVRNYTIPDVITRAKRQQGWAVYQPVGWDSFGLPAENYAIKTGISPQESTKQAIKKYQQQYRAMGWAVDWSKEINTTDPGYYKWTQWIFTKLFEQGLAYQKESPQWWCEQCQTILADEQVLAGKCWRHDAGDDPLVTKKQLKQWFFKITDYADEILEATDDLDWTSSVKASQKSWIGRSQGTEIDFEVIDHTKSLKVFTTRPDTVYGATFMVLAPEHPMVSEIMAKEQHSAVESYVQQTLQKSDIERQENKEKTGVFTGTYAKNPISGESIPIWVADYVLYGYGTGAIMAVPAHDERDFAFAKRFDLPIRFVVEPVYGTPQGDDHAKQSVYVVLRNPKDQTAVVLDWGPRQERHGGQMLIGGTVESGESFEAAARREIKEETGYEHVELVRESEFSGHGYFYSNTKQQNVHASGKGLLFDLVDDTPAKTQLDPGEQGKFQVTWQPLSKIAGLLDDGVHEAMYRYLVLEEPYTGEGLLVNSNRYSGLASSVAKEKLAQALQKQGQGSQKITYKMRDWLISRQRYWGAPIPIVHCKTCGPVAVPEEQLPIELPVITKYQPTGNNVSVLASVDDWVQTTCSSCNQPARRETDTMDGYVCSSWYFLRYLNPSDDQQAWDTKLAQKWMPVDFYNGGDHATAHLLYARFFMHFFHSLGLTGTAEPFAQMVYNGKVRASDGTNFSKSKGNGIDPLEVIESGYGADALRVYEMFAAPVEQDIIWDMQGIPGTYRFLNRVWNLTQAYLVADEKILEPAALQELESATHAMIQKATQDIAACKFNTAIAALMETLNSFYRLQDGGHLVRSDAWKFALESMLQLLAPFAPHVTEELWQELGHPSTIHVDQWPMFDPKKLVRDTMNIVVQVNGKVRANITVSSDADEQAVTDAALQNERILPYIQEAHVKKTIYIPTKLLNIVV